METERELLEAIQSGDREALRRLYNRFSGYAMAISRRYIDERDDALDVVQDSFVSILTSIYTFKHRDEGSLKAWVSRIVANKAVDWIKHHNTFVSTDDFPDETEENEPDVEQVPPEILNRLISRLPIGCRTVLNLYVFEQLPHKEIAHRLGIKEKSSASQFSRAKHLLAEMINEYLNSQRI